MAVATGVTISTIGDSAPSLLSDGRPFFPDFGDSGLSYERLLNAVRHADTERALQELADEIAKIERKAELSLEQLKLQAAALLLRDLKKQGWIVCVEREMIWLDPATARPQSSPTEAKQVARQGGEFARQDQLNDPAVR
ncbi:MAG: hypothetical protein L0Y75_09610, partial [Acidobacteria bacterium]|nr:hypothetical protein [Acidobacteriota bacterium]